jgi:hypothetical protein
VMGQDHGQRRDDRERARTDLGSLSQLVRGCPSGRDRGDLPAPLA